MNTVSRRTSILIAYTILFSIGYCFRRFDVFSGFAASMILSVVLASPFPYLLFLENGKEGTNHKASGYRLLETLVTGVPLVGGMVHQGFCVMPNYVNLMIIVSFALSVTPLILFHKAMSKQVAVLQYIKTHILKVCLGSMVYLILWYLCVLSVL